MVLVVFQLVLVDKLVVKVGVVFLLLELLVLRVQLFLVLLVVVVVLWVGRG